MFGPAIRYYGGLPTLRADPLSAPTKRHHNATIRAILDGLNSVFHRKNGFISVNESHLIDVVH